MNFIDEKYIGLYSPRLQKFTKKKRGLYNFRCPYCGDSQKNKNRARGFFFLKNSDYIYKCHNCGVGRSLSNFLKDHDVTLHDQYVMERFKSGTTGKSTNVATPKFNFTKPKFNLKAFNLKRISELNITHPARKYLEDRQIDAKFLKDLYYCEHFKKWTNEQKKSFDSVENDEPRIVIPLRNSDEIIGFQGRSLNPTSQLRYITIMLNEEAPKVYGLDRIDKNKSVYVVEGPFDSLFLVNSVAMVGSDLNCRSLGWSDYIWVYDNEPRNREIINRITKTIDRGDKVVIWPKNIQQKDINDMFLAGHDVQTVVKSNTYSSIEATIKLNDWKRV